MLLREGAMRNYGDDPRRSVVVLTWVVEGYIKLSGMFWNQMPLGPPPRKLEIFDVIHLGFNLASRLHFT